MKKKRACLLSSLISVFLLVSLFAITIWGFSTATYSASISPDGKILVITTNSDVSMYQLKNGKKLQQERGKPYGSQAYQGFFSYIAWSPDGSSLAVGKLDNGVWVWDTQNWDLLTERDGEIGAKNEPSFAWSPDGQQLALGTGDEIWVWSKNQNQWKQKGGTHDDLISITWTKRGQLLKLQGHDIYDVETGKLLSKLNHYIDGYGKASWSQDGSHVYIFFDLSGGVMDVNSNKYEFNAGIYPEFAWSSEGRYFASVEECQNEILVWDTENNKLIRQEKQGDIIYSLTWTSDGNLLALGVIAGRTVLWNTSTGQILFKTHTLPNPSCFF